MVVVGAPHLVRGLLALADLRPRVEVQASRCSRARGSGCTLCLAQCPVAALRADDELGAPVVDSDACVGCGICVAACPTEALAGVGVSPDALRAAAEGSLGLRVRCANVRTDGPADEGEPPGEVRTRARRVACLATLHPEALTAAVATLEPDGVLELTHGECASCPVAAGPQADEVVTLTQGLAARVAPGRAVVRRAVLERPTPGHAAAPVSALPGAAPRSRRALLGGSRDGAGPAVPGTGAAAERADGEGALGARAAMLSVAPDAPLSRPLAGPGCTTCAACTRVCPTGALRWSETASTAVLEVDETACVGCAECVRICPEDVLGLGCTLPAGTRPSFGPSQVTRVRFTRCARCGVRLRAGEQGSCSRCSSRRGLLDDVWTHQEP